MYANSISKDAITLEEETATPPLHIFDAQPIIGRKITVLNLEIESTSEVNLIITGLTWPYKASLDAIGVSLGHIEQQSGDGSRKVYFRVWKNIDITGADADKFKEMLKDVFHNAAMRVTIDKLPEEGTPVAEFIGQLKKLACLFFAPITAA